MGLKYNKNDRCMLIGGDCECIIIGSIEYNGKRYNELRDKFKARYDITPEETVMFNQTDDFYEVKMLDTDEIEVAWSSDLMMYNRESLIEMIEGFTGSLKSIEWQKVTMPDMYKLLDTLRSMYNKLQTI